MLLFPRRFWAGLIDGSITLTFRRWPRARVKPGGRYRCHPVGVLEVDGVDKVLLLDVDDAEARQAGFADRAELRRYVEEGAPSAAADPAVPLFRVRLHHGGDGDRVAGALDATLTTEQVHEIHDKLRRLDDRSTVGAWTARTLALIAERPRVAAGRLAEHLERDKAEFKADVVKLKKLGLTQSFEVGYELSPRGKAYLEAAGAGAAPRPGKPKKPPTARTPKVSKVSKAAKSLKSAKGAAKSPAKARASRQKKR